MWLNYWQDADLFPALEKCVVQLAAATEDDTNWKHLNFSGNVQIYPNTVVRAVFRTQAGSSLRFLWQMRRIPGKFTSDVENLLSS